MADMQWSPEKTSLLTNVHQLMTGGQGAQQLHGEKFTEGPEG